jgi:SH3-like domain-containing protein
MKTCFQGLIIVVIICLSCGAAMAERLSVSARIANIRSGPGTNYEILWKVEQYHPIAVIKKQGPWYHFRDFEGDEGWIHQSLVKKNATVITAKDKCNVRKGPGTNHAIVFQIEKGIPFLILERQKSWLRIKHADGDSGWIHKSLVW